MTYQKENDKLVKSFLNRTYFEAWRDKEDVRLENFRRLEIFLTPNCDLACKYCVGKGTLVLTSNLTWKLIEEIKEEQIILGLKQKRKGGHYQLIKTKVIATNKRLAETIKIETDKGSVVCTPEHEWLRKNHGFIPVFLKDSTTSWKVGDIKWIGYPYIFAENKKYREGWLAGMILGDGCLMNKDYPAHWDNNRKQMYWKPKVRAFVLVVKDKEILDRFKLYSQIEFYDFIHNPDNLPGIRTNKEANYIKLRKISEIKTNDFDWNRGFLGGIFDAEGCYSQGILRISQKEGQTLEKIKKTLIILDIPFAEESYKNNGVKSIRIKGQENVLKLFSLSNPILKRKKQDFFTHSIFGNAKILGIKKNGIKEVYNLQTESENYIANGLVSHNCYLTHFKEELYPKSLVKSDVIMHNLEMLLDWLIKRGLAPEIDYFSGEPFAQNIGFDALELILDKFKDAEKKPHFIVVPTNYTFILNKRRTKRVESLLDYSKRINIPVLLSASFDGKYCEENRPFVGKEKKRDNAYYEKCFAFNANYNFGFHPMIYSERIEKWKDNFLWFQVNFKRYNIQPHKVYLLEIRNVEWSDKQIKEYMKFIEFIITWAFNNIAERSVEKYLQFLFKQRGFNILSNCFSSVGRGIGCSFQSCLYVRMGDLAIIPCHRVSDSSHILAHFITNHNKILGIKARNPELLIGSRSFDFRTQPICETCIMKELCQGQCMGAMREVTGDMFSPIPTVCKMFHAKIMAMIQTYKKLGFFNVILEVVNEPKKKALLQIDELLTNKGGIQSGR